MFSQNEVWVPWPPVCMCAQSPQQTSIPWGHQRWPASRAQRCPAAASRKVAATSSPPPPHPPPSPLRLDRRMLLLPVPMETRSCAADGDGRMLPPFAGCTLLLQPKAPNVEVNPSPPGRQTGRTRANTSQSQPEVHNPSKGVTLKPTVKSPSPLDANITEEKLQQHRLKSQNVTQI